MIVGPELVDSTGATKRFFGRDALACWYVAHGDTLYFLNAGRAVREFDWCFIPRSVKGRMELYMLDLHGYSLIPPLIRHYDYYYVRLNGEWLDPRPLAWNRARLMKMFKNCPVVMEMIRATNDVDLLDALPGYVRSYNERCARE